MPNYRRRRQSGGTYFLTINLHDRRRTLLVVHIELLRRAFKTVMEERAFSLDACVILPDHLHCIMTLPLGDDDYATRIRLIKSRFTRAVLKFDPAAGGRGRKGERLIWQSRYWEHTIRDDADFENHVDYIHFNPVKHDYVNRPIDWSHSSIHRFVKDGILDSTWGTTGDVVDMDLD